MRTGNCFGSNWATVAAWWRTFHCSWIVGGAVFLSLTACGLAPFWQRRPPGPSCSVIFPPQARCFRLHLRLRPLRRGVVVSCRVPPSGGGVVSECSLALLRGALLTGHSLLRLGCDDCNHEVVACFVLIFYRFLFPSRLSFSLGLLRPLSSAGGTLSHVREHTIYERDRPLACRSSPFLLPLSFPPSLLP
ncbi:hypothetical protein B0H14DRAFT_2957245 [Mycena olivaceomarginata]|nr:hypothetical protein B0H14DRAFT_2957245 [Mycena olivaceomarginata]